MFHFILKDYIIQVIPRSHKQNPTKIDHHYLYYDTIQETTMSYVKALVGEAIVMDMTLIHSGGDSPELRKPNEKICDDKSKFIEGYPEHITHLSVHVYVKAYDRDQISDMLGTGIDHNIAKQTSFVKLAAKDSE